MFYDDSMPEKIEQVINADLANVDKWYEANGMRRNTYEEKSLNRLQYSSEWKRSSRLKLDRISIYFALSF